MTKSKYFNRNTIFIFFLLLVSAAMLIMPGLYQSPYARDEERYSARVLKVDNSLVKQFGIVKAGSQGLRVRLLDGPHAGEVIGADNILLGKMESDKVFLVGDRVFVVLTTEGGHIMSATAYDHYRLHTELLLVVLFAVLLIVVTGWSGAKALCSFAFAVLAMWKILLPGILSGKDPILMALLVVTLISGATLFSVAGVGKTALVAWLGSLLGIALTATLAFLLFPPFRLHGAIQAYSETLLYSGFDGLNLQRLFIAAVFLGASGAVVDLSIDVSASMNEVIRKRPDLSVKELTWSGLHVGRPMATTMVITLLMAYMSEYMALLMVLLSKGIPPVQVVNINYIAAEVMKTVVGSFGLVTVAPFTAIVGGLIYVKGKRSDAEADDTVVAVKPIAHHSLQNRSEPV
jgi:uncharacterized membrane protein